MRQLRSLESTNVIEKLIILEGIFTNSKPMAQDYPILVNQYLGLNSLFHQYNYEKCNNNYDLRVMALLTSSNVNLRTNATVPAKSPKFVHWTKEQ